MSNTSEIDADARPWSWNEVDTELINEMQRQAELRLAGQVQFQIARDQRITTIMGFCATAAFAVLAAGLGAWNANHLTIPVVAAVAAAFVFLVAAAGLLGIASRVQEFHPLGTEPKNLYGARRLLIKEAKGSLIQNVQTMIDQNASSIERSIKVINSAYVCIALAPIVAFTLFGLAKGLSSTERSPVSGTVEEPVLVPVVVQLAYPPLVPIPIQTCPIPYIANSLDMKTISAKPVAHH